MVNDKLKATVLLGAQLLIKHGLDDWKIKIVNRRTSLGETEHSSKTIELSKRFLLICSEKEFRETMLHEIAHALVGPGHGHGPVFIGKCAEIGGMPRPFSSVTIRSYVYDCEKCGATGGHNKVLNAYCKECFENGVYAKLIGRKNKIEVNCW